MLTIDPNRVTVETFAQWSFAEFGGRVAVLPNAAVFKHCLHLGRFHRSPVSVEVYADRESLTAYAILCSNIIEQWVVVSAEDAASLEFSSRHEIDEFLKSV